MDSGQRKVDAAASQLRAINPDVDVHALAIDVTDAAPNGGFAQLLAQVEQASLVLCCVDNYAARLAVNRACLQANRLYFEVSRGRTALCYEVRRLTTTNVNL